MKTTKPRKEDPKVVDVRRDLTKCVVEEYLRVLQEHPNKEPISVLCFERGVIAGWMLKEKN